MKKIYHSCRAKVLALAVMLLFQLQPNLASAQNSVVRGVVRDERGETLPGVSIKIKGSDTGTITDGRGGFVLPVPGNATLSVSYIGYMSQESAVSGRTLVNFDLSVSSKSMNEVVVLAYGSQSKRNITGSVQTINSKELADLPVAQVTQKLQGKLAGVEITQTTGTPGAGMSVRIRGAASLSAGTSPLYVVDGFPIEGDIANINPDEIESITVLKDASSGSLYGSRAANGVVLVTTKHAKAGQTSIGVNTYTGIQQVPMRGRPDMMDGQQFAQFEKDIATENGQTPNAAYQNPSQYGKGTDWYAALLRTAPIKNYSINISSNKDKFSTNVTAGYFKQEGVLRNSNYERYSVRANSEYQASKVIKVGFNIAPTYTINNAPQTDGVWYAVPSILESALLTTPLAPFKNADGSIPLTATGPGLFPNPNWYNVLNIIKNRTATNHLLSNSFLEVKPFDGLTLKTTINVDMGQATYNNFTPSTAGSLFRAPLQPTTAIDRNTQYYTWLSENTAMYKKSIGRHNFDALLGYTAQKYRLQSDNTAASNFPDDLVQTFNAAKTTVTTSDVQEWSMLSYIGRLNYNYADKYMLSAAIRRDGSSRFGSLNKFGNFPSVSAGWIVSEEKFMSAIKPVSLLKLRGSYGATGNNNIGNYTQYAQVASTNYTFNENVTSGRSSLSLANTSLGWETTVQSDLGLDLGLLSNRISFSYDYYNKTTSNLLYSVNVPVASGFSTYTTNIGKINFWGHEFSLNTQNLVGGFKWNTNLNITFNNNKVLALGTANAAIYGDFTITQVGKPVGQFYGMEWQGVYKNQADFDKSPHYIGAEVGMIKFKDVNGDGKITFDNKDKEVLGNSAPKFIYGMTNNFSYANFDLGVVISGQYGNKIANRIEQFTENLDGVFNVTKDVAHRWKSEQDPGDGRYGKVKTGTTYYERDNLSSRFLYDGSFLAIKNLTLGYTIPLKSTKYLHSIRLYTSVQQLFVFTKYPGANPEVSGTNVGGQSSVLNLGNDYSSYPVPRTLTFGLNVNF